MSNDVQLQQSEKGFQIFVGFISVAVLALVALLYWGKTWSVDVGFDTSGFPLFHAILNGLVSVCLVVALWAVKQRKLALHKQTMFASFVLSGIFLVSYVFYHSISEQHTFGGEGIIRPIYFFILITHIILAGGSLPFILITFYRAWKNNFVGHKKIAKITWPIWLYVAVTGVLVYCFMAPYYG